MPINEKIISRSRCSGDSDDCAEPTGATTASRGGVTQLNEHTRALAEAAVCTQRTQLHRALPTCSARPDETQEGTCQICHQVNQASSVMLMGNI